MKTIHKDELRDMMSSKKNLVVVNVLSQEAFDREHIPGSINIPVGDDHFRDMVQQKIPNKDTPVVVYCANSDCQASPKAAQLLEDMGYTQVYDYEAGLEDYCEAMTCVASAGD